MTMWGGPPQTRRERWREAVARRVRIWVDGVEVNRPGDPRRQIERQEPTWAPMRLVQFFDTDGEPVTVGRWSAIHHSVTIFQGGLHHVDWVGVGHFDYAEGALTVQRDRVFSRGPVRIGSDVWIAYQAIVMSGVSIGHGAVVAARAVVSRDVEPYSIVGGNPARHIRYRFDEPTREALLRIAWWDWPQDKLARFGHEINSPDVAGFIARHDPARDTEQT